MNPREIRTKIVCEAFDMPILLLGRCGEGNATRLSIDVSGWQSDGGAFAILVKRADGELFTAGNVTQGNGIVTWLIAESEIGAPGYGEIELNYTDESGNIKTARCDTRVFSSMEIDGLPPSGTTWSQLVLAAVGDANAAASAAASGASSAQASANSAAQNASAALSSKNSATHSATNAAASARQAAQSEQRAQALFDSFHDKLCNAQIYGTKETASFDADGRIVQIIHTDNTTGEIVRTDVFTYAGSMITETRTLPTGEKQVNVYDMTSFVFQYDVQEGTT